MNSFLDGLRNEDNYVLTENNAVALKRLENDVYQMFAVGGGYRTRSDEDCILLFKNAYEEDKTLALKCLFYLRDCRGGQGIRRFFRVCYHWLASYDTDAARRNMPYITEYGRFDDLYCLVDTPLESEMFLYMNSCFANALEVLDHPTKENAKAYFVFKWLKSENASSKETKRLANKTREAFCMTHREYRKLLSWGRNQVKVLERLMSDNSWEDIDFSKLPSKAGLQYRNAFERRSLIADKYKEFAMSKETKVNSDTLYPYEIVSKAADGAGNWSYGFKSLSDTERAILEKYWDNLPDYLGGKPCKMMCVVDTSGSMCREDAAAPINVAISLGMYCAERIGEPFKNHYISFSERPQLIKIEGIDFVDKVRRIYSQNLCEDTNLEAVFDLLLKVAKRPETKVEDIPDTLVIISDMQINEATGSWRSWSAGVDEDNAQLTMDKIRVKWTKAGVKMPKLVYWNVDARGQANILDKGPDVSFVSGFSPVIFESVLTGKTGWDLCLAKLNSQRYEVIK